VASKLNHHFVPKYLFRLFSGGQKYIHLVTKASSKVIFDASIRHQCARHKFYGTEDVEDGLAILDAHHAAGYRAAIRECWSDSPAGFSDDEFFWLFQGLMLQRARTPRAAEGLAHSSENLALDSFREYVKASPDDGMRDQMIEAIDKGQVSVKEQILRPLLHSLSIGLRSVIGITDLNLVLLRNATQLPFVFGDSPCVFYNRYLYDVPFISGLGIQSPGLMILMPLNEDTQVMLYDPGTYEIEGTPDFVDVIEKSDISQLNALQVHSASTAIYFAHRASADYLVDLITAHRPLFKQSHNEFRRWPPGQILIDGKPNDQEVMHMYESQLPLKVDLSFLQTKAMPADENPRRPRSRELRNELNAILDSYEEEDVTDDSPHDLSDGNAGSPDHL
jgi:hypothetical protein